MSNFKTLVLPFFLTSVLGWTVLAASLPNSCGEFYSNQQDPVRAPFFENVAPRTLGRRLVQDYNNSLPNIHLWNDHYVRYQPTGETFGSVKTRLVSQEASLECAIFSNIGAVESALANRGTPIQISAPYLVAQKLLAVIKERVNQTRNPFIPELDEFYFIRSGQQYNLFHLLKQVGIMPNDIWIPKKPLSTWVFKEIYEEIEHKTTQAIFEFNTIRFNSLADANAWKEARINQIFNDVIAEKYLGHWPFPFTVGTERDLTPVTYAQKNGINLNEVPEVIYTDSNPYPFHLQTNTMNNVFHWSQFPNSKKPFLHQPITKDAFYNKIKDALQNHKAIVLDVRGQFIGNIGHSLAVTDVEVRNGKVVAIELKNSEAKWLGDGYVWFSVDAIHDQVYRAWIYDLH